MQNDIVTQILEPEIKRKAVSAGNKILVSPYQGCSHNCLFCPANDGYLKKRSFTEFREKHIIRVVKNVIEHLDCAVNNKKEKFHVHLSPVADPFQPIEKEYRLSEKVVKYCSEFSIPIAICTKGLIPDTVIPFLQTNPSSFVQISIPSIIQSKNKFIVRGNGAQVYELLQMSQKLVNMGINVIFRIDPIFPYITDDEEDFEELVNVAKQIGVRFILSSVVDIVEDALIREKMYLESYRVGMYLKYESLFSTFIHGRFHAKEEYRHKIFNMQREICKRYGLSYGITWEPDNSGMSINERYNYIQQCDLELYWKLRG